MYGWSARVLLRHYLEQGLSKTEIAQTIGVSRRTVHHWILTGQLERDLDEAAVRYRVRPSVESKLDAFRGILLARLEQYPRLSAVRLYDEIRAAGFAGSYSLVKQYVHEVRPGRPADPVVRFETPPGHQAQVDFAEFRLPWGKRYALLVVLGYSRLLWVQFYPRQTLAVLMRGLEEAFAAFGGVPAELLFDQMKAVIIEDQREIGGKLLENQEFMRFAAHWGFRIRACRPYRARTKGKVERPVSYVRQGFFYGREFLNDADLNEQARTWTRLKANARLHRTTGEVPSVRFERDERAQLQTLTRHPYRSVIALQPRQQRSPHLPVLPNVERRSLATYGRLSAVRS